MAVPPSGSLYLAELDALIARAEAACGRYRYAAEEEALAPRVARNRRGAWQRMEEMLAGLRVQREPVTVERERREKRAPRRLRIPRRPRR